VSPRSGVELFGPLLLAVGSLVALAGILSTDGTEIALGSFAVMVALRRARGKHDTTPLLRSGPGRKSNLWMYSTLVSRWSSSRRRWALSASASGSDKAAMGILYLVGAAISAGLFFYLLFAMLKPENFS
jgi:K+-transporting ATPase KdpF subunit